jgi:DDE superfamily endonuclease
MFSKRNILLPMLNVCAIIYFVIQYNNLRRRSTLTRTAILLPGQSPWIHILENADDGSFLELTGFDRLAFAHLLQVLFPNPLPQHMGRPRLLDEKDKVGLYLFYVNSTMTINNLCLIFGTTPSRCSAVISFMMSHVYDTLKYHEVSKVSFPKTYREKQYLASLVQNREPKIRDVIGFTDGVSIPVKCSSSPMLQATDYNGYHHDTMCNNVFCFASTGKIIYACINYPGSFHDSQVAVGLIRCVLEHLGRYKICVDQGFPRSGDLFDKFVGPMSQRTRNNIAPLLRRAILQRHNLYVSLRQSSEWGMRALQGTFSRLKARLPSNKSKRKYIIGSIVFLHNFRTEYVGLNQIATVFNPLYEEYLHLDNYDRIARYYDNNY